VLEEFIESGPLALSPLEEMGKASRREGYGKCFQNRCRLYSTNVSVVDSPIRVTRRSYLLAIVENPLTAHLSFSRTAANALTLSGYCRNGKGRPGYLPSGLSYA